ncbi:MAG TPA: AraC family transcriptional regulator [Armatimonadota bacterium]|jgi:AraC-like DNA-binding protein
MQEDYAWFECAITALERVLERRITIIDNQGLFHTPTGQLIFPALRQSHRKLAVCQCGFSQRCIDFCRHQMNQQCLRQPYPFRKTCWKGVTEIVVPLRGDEQHWGMCYLGAWRTPEVELPALPPDFADAYRALPAWRDDYFADAAPLLEAFVAGLAARLIALRAVGQPPLDRARRIRDYIRYHAASQHASLSELAHTLHLSGSRTSRVLHELFGCSFTRLLHQERINRAKVLLRSGDDKLAAIALATGFNDEYHFNKTFHKHTGHPPGQYRRLRDL